MLICPKCGKTSGEKEFVEAFCIDCYEFNIRLPKGLKVELCKRCSRMKLQGEWQQLNRRKISEYIMGKCMGDFSKTECDIDTGTCTFIFEKSGKMIKAQRHVELERNVTVCPDCSRSSGGYFEATVQIRGDADAVKSEAERLCKHFTKKTFVPKIDEMHGGLDIYVGNSKVVAAVLQKMGYKPVISRKLFGKKEGHNIYRVTYAIRV